MARRSKASPLTIQRLYEEFLSEYLTKTSIELPDGLNEEEYTKAMDSITKAMAYAFLNGYEKGFG